VRRFGIADLDSGPGSAARERGLAAAVVPMLMLHRFAAWEWNRNDGLVRPLIFIDSLWSRQAAALRDRASRHVP
jgi:hypothetical protein